MKLGVSFKQQVPDGPFDTIVIGSGIGGLACAAALAKYAGHRVLVLEQHYRLGGFTHAYTRAGYEWDVGVHYLGQLGEGQSGKVLFDNLTDGAVSWARLPDVYERVYLGERVYEYVAGAERFVERLGADFPRERDVIARYVALCADVMRASAHYYLERALPRWLSRLAGDALRAPLLRHAQHTTYATLRTLTDNEELIGVLTAQFGDYGAPPGRSSFARHASVVMHFLDGGYYPVGGSTVIARGLGQVIERGGGVLCHSAEVAQVVIEGRRAVGVRMVNGHEFRARHIVSNAGLAVTYGRLVAPEHAPVETLARLEPSMGYVALTLGFRKSDAELGLNGTNVWLYPNARHDENWARFLVDEHAPLPMVYVGFGSAKDPTWATRFPSRATVEMLAAYPWQRVARWQQTKWYQRGPDYDALKARLSERLQNQLFAAVPQLKGRVDFAELSTPLTTRHFTGHPSGEMYGVDPTPARYATPLHARTMIEGLYLTGSDLAASGITGALRGGVLTATAIGGLGVRRRVNRPAHHEPRPDR